MIWFYLRLNLSDACAGPLVLKGLSKAFVKREAVKEQLLTWSFCITGQNHFSLPGLFANSLLNGKSNQSRCILASCNIKAVGDRRATSTKLKFENNVPALAIYLLS